MHECINQVTTWFKNTHKKKPTPCQPQSKMNNYNNKQKIGWKLGFNVIFFLNCCMITDRFYSSVHTSLLPNIWNQYRCLTQGGESSDGFASEKSSVEQLSCRYCQWCEATIIYFRNCGGFSTVLKISLGLLKCNGKDLTLAVHWMCVCVFTMSLYNLEFSFFKEP